MQAAYEYIWKTRNIALEAHDTELEAYADALLRNQHDLLQETYLMRNRDENDIHNPTEQPA
jgi:aminoglycoside/choline kinase family phosphotransferase